MKRQMAYHLISIVLTVVCSLLTGCVQDLAIKGREQWIQQEVPRLLALQTGHKGTETWVRVDEWKGRGSQYRLSSRCQDRRILIRGGNQRSLGKAGLRCVASRADIGCEQCNQAGDMAPLQVRSRLRRARSGAGRPEGSIRRGADSQVLFWPEDGQFAGGVVGRWCEYGTPGRGNTVLPPPLFQELPGSFRYLSDGVHFAPHVASVAYSIVRCGTPEG